jgi:ubiquinone/menaquinone biosynthesis C-methylase UbiE
LLKETIDILVDPINKKNLKLENSTVQKNHAIEGILISESGNEYVIRNGVADLMPKRKDISIDSKLLDAWDKLQENGETVYDKFPELNCAVKSRKDMEAFRKFCSFHGTVLDVGCGPRMPVYLENNEEVKLAIGIDPLISFNNVKLSDDIDLLSGMGEFLPFKDETFDVISFATSFDHMIEPITALKEVKRILKKDGFVCFWINDDIPKRPSLFRRAVRKTKRILFSKDSTAKKTIEPQQQREEEQKSIVQAMQIPEGAEDQFHLRHIRNSEFDSLCSSVKLKRIEKIGPVTINDLFVKYQKDI